MSSVGGPSAALGPREGTVVPRLIFVGLVVLWTWVGNEFSVDASPFWYQKDFMGIPLHYPLLAGFLLLVSPFVFATPRVSVVARLRSVGLWVWAVLAGLVMLIALTRAVLEMVPQPFADWRNIAVMGAVAIWVTRWLSAQPWREWALTDLAIAYGVLSAVLLAQFAAGGGTTLFGVRTPVFYSVTLSLATFAAIVATYLWVGGTHGYPSWYSWLIRGTAVASSLLVLLSFRRSHWLALGLGMAGVMIIHLAQRQLSAGRLLAIGCFMTAVVVIIFLSLGSETVIERLDSFLPSSDSEFSATNEDHVNDLRDAVTVIEGNPLFGLGVGKFYETDLIAAWKANSFEVHNAPLHVWLRFGLLGLIVYLGFHWRWVISMLRMRTISSAGATAMTGAAIYLVAQFAGTLVQTWPYGRFQVTVHNAVVLGAFLSIVPAYLGAWTRTRGTRPVSGQIDSTGPTGRLYE